MHVSMQYAAMLPWCLPNDRPVCNVLTNTKERQGTTELLVRLASVYLPGSYTAKLYGQVSYD